MTPLLLILLAPLLIASEPVFTDPDARGSLLIFDQQRVPNIYRGVWADQPRNCHRTGDQGVRMAIGSRDIDFLPVTRVEGYSDHPAIVVVLHGEHGERPRLFLDISEDGNHIRVSEGYGTREVLLRRCPPTPPTHNQPDAGARFFAGDGGKWMPREDSNLDRRNQNP